VKKHHLLYKELGKQTDRQIRTHVCTYVQMYSERIIENVTIFDVTYCHSHPARRRTDRRRPDVTTTRRFTFELIKVYGGSRQ